LTTPGPTCCTARIVRSSTVAADPAPFALAEAKALPDGDELLEAAGLADAAVEPDAAGLAEGEPLAVALIAGFAPAELAALAGLAAAGALADDGAALGDPAHAARRRQSVRGSRLRVVMLFTIDGIVPAVRKQQEAFRQKSLPLA
jgi:hypothetical protein